MPELFVHHRRLAEEARTLRVTGRVTSVTGLTVMVEGLRVPVGSLCRIDIRDKGYRYGADGGSILGQVVAFGGDRAVVLTLAEPLGISVGDSVTSTSGMQCVPVGRQMLGSVLDGLGRPVAGRTHFIAEAHYPVFAAPPTPLGRAVHPATGVCEPQASTGAERPELNSSARDAAPRPARRPIDQPLATGIRAIDALHTLGGGQRVGIFSGTGVGKTVLMGMITRYTDADVVVVALVGERGREVGDFVRKELGESGLRRAVLVVSTSDESPVLRVRAAFVATAVAEYFRDLGRDVLLLTDSTTRVAMAQRQIALSAAEPPATRGYPPSVFSLLPKLVERSGRTDRGSITGVYTVLVEGDDLHEPVSDCLRGTLDGHIWLSRSLANRGHYPAISVLESISRLMPDVVDKAHQEAAAEVRRVLAVWTDIEDLVNVGAYAPGANVEFDLAVKMKPAIDDLLRQASRESSEAQLESEPGDPKVWNSVSTPADSTSACAMRGALGETRQRARLAETRDRLLRLASDIRELRKSLSAKVSRPGTSAHKPAAGQPGVTGAMSVPTA